MIDIGLERAIDVFYEFRSACIPCAVALHPNITTPTIYTGEIKGSINLNDLTNCFVFSNFAIGYDQHIRAIRLYTGEKPSINKSSSGIPEKCNSKLHHPTAKSDYNAVISAAKDFSERYGGKVVVSRIDVVEGRDLKTVVLRYFTASSNCFRTLLFDGTNTWIGATPEVLMQVNDIKTHLYTMSLAGTKSESDNKQWNKKNNVEHSVVTNFIVSQLTSLGLNPIVGNASELRFNDIVHLKHDISVTGKIDADTIFRTLSPTPAVCGYPRDKARDFIAAHEGFDRDLYAGMIGTIGNNGQLNLYVNLRCAQQICSGDISKYMLYAGGGINQLSEAVDEWNETTAKMESLKHAITK